VNNRPVAEKYIFKKWDINSSKHKKYIHNLVILCEQCHHSVHSKKISIQSYIKTSNGLELQYTQV
jgi:hypothetical protein